MSEVPPDVRVVHARAKVNLWLRVLGVRPDGYHDLETLVMPIGLADRLRIQAGAGPDFHTLSLALEVLGEPHLVRGIPVDESNLALRAAVALAEEVRVRGFADIALEKLVPSAAGLGGGSSDAAAVLRALNELWGCGLGPEELAAVGASVGSDVPALLAEGPVVASGRGERVRPVEVAPLAMVLVRFPLALSTPEVFRWWDEEGATGPDPGTLFDAAQRGDIETLGDLLFNDLEMPVVRRHPEVGRAKEILLAGGAVGATMSGSGPSVVGLLPGGGSRLDPSAESKLEALAGSPPIYV